MLGKLYTKPSRRFLGKIMVISICNVFKFTVELWSKKILCCELDCAVMFLVKVNPICHEYIATDKGSRMIHDIG